MKNIFKFFSMMVAASTMMMFASCSNEENNGDNPDTPVTYTVTVNCNDATLGTVSVSPLQSSYNAGDQVTITATAASNADFVNWNGSITDNPYTFTVSENVTFTANFQAKPQATYSATLNGTALDIAGWSDAMCADMSSTWMWLFQAAKSAEGNSVYFPFLVSYFTGTSTTDMGIYNIELYEQTFYQSGEDTYGDWQLYTSGTSNMNCTALDMTSHTVSLTMSCTMYSLTDVVENNADADSATKGTLAETLSNVAFEVYTGKALRKMNIAK